MRLILCRIQQDRTPLTAQMVNVETLHQYPFNRQKMVFPHTHGALMARRFKDACTV